MKETDIRRFWDRVEQGDPSDCWQWKAGKTGRGYGAMHVGGKQVLAHRLSFEIARGTPPPCDLVVRHTCDNRVCVNPAHLLIGTHKDNTADAISRGRATPPPLISGAAHWRRRHPEKVKVGSAVPTSKLTESSVRRILAKRVKGTTVAALSKSFSIDKTIIYDICNGRLWKHVHGTEGAPTLEQLRQIPKLIRPGAKITRDIAIDIKRRLHCGETGRSIAKLYNIHFATVSDIKIGKTWTDV